MYFCRLKNYSRYLFIVFAWCFTDVCLGQSDFGSDSDSTLTGDTRTLGDVYDGIVKREGGSANSGIVYYFYENKINVGLPELHFIDTNKSLFHRYNPYMKNNSFRTDRGNIGLITEDLEFFHTDELLFSYGKSPFEQYRYTPFNTKFYQNIVPYVELF
jgi:hypothetical protein